MTTTPKKQADERAEGMTARLTAPVLIFDFAAEIEQLREEEHWLRDGRISKTLVKHSDFRIVLMLMCNSHDLI